MTTLTKDMTTFTREITIQNKLGLHARAAAKLVQLTARFSCEIELTQGSKKINAKSIMGVMSLGATKGVTICITTTGPDAEAAMNQLIELIDNKFGEGQ